MIKRAYNYTSESKTCVILMPDDTYFQISFCIQYFIPYSKFIFHSFQFYHKFLIANEQLIPNL